jgi:hypothetical protein
MLGYKSKFAGRLITSLTQEELEEERQAVEVYTERMEAEYVEPIILTDR